LSLLSKIPNFIKTSCWRCLLYSSPRTVILCIYSVRWGISCTRVRACNL
jgi:hypothetical protein